MDSSTARRRKSVCAILDASLSLFREYGFEDTTVRRIAEKSGVALGMVNHYFGSKDFLGAQSLELLRDYLTAPLHRYVDMAEDPVLYGLVSARLFHGFIFRHGYKNLYIDSLKYDFSFKFCTPHPDPLFDALRAKYGFDCGEDEGLLYFKYVPLMMEKTLILKKEEGLFPSISDTDIPLIICRASLGRFVSEDEITSRDSRARLLSGEIEGSLGHRPPMSAVEDFVRRSPLFEG